MATWLIVVISVYCGISYGIAIMMLAIDHTTINLKTIIEFIFFPIWMIWLFIELGFEE